MKSAMLAQKKKKKTSSPGSLPSHRESPSAKRTKKKRNEIVRVLFKTSSHDHKMFIFLNTGPRSKRERRNITRQRQNGKNIEDLQFWVQALLDGGALAVWDTFGDFFASLSHERWLSMSAHIVRTKIKNEGKEGKRNPLFYMGHSIMCLQSFLQSAMHIYNTIAPRRILYSRLHVTQRQTHNTIQINRERYSKWRRGIFSPADVPYHKIVVLCSYRCNFFWRPNQVPLRNGGFAIRRSPLWQKNRPIPTEKLKGKRTQTVSRQGVQGPAPNRCAGMHEARRANLLFIKWFAHVHHQSII